MLDYFETAVIFYPFFVQLALTYNLYIIYRKLVACTTTLFFSKLSYFYIHGNISLELLFYIFLFLKCFKEREHFSSRI